MRAGHDATLLLALFLAYVNGANDVSKGIATLVGSGVTSYSRAMLWGMLWTSAGAMTSMFLARAMVVSFAGGLLTGSAVPTLAAAIATIAGAAAWVMIATRSGLPVSTTHAIVGAIAAVGTVAYGRNGINWPAFSARIAAPLLLSPVASLALTALLLKAWNRVAQNAGSGTDCVCLETAARARFCAGAPGGPATAAPGPPGVGVFTGPAEICAITYPSAVRLTSFHLHWFTSGATSFARGLNDAPKMAALILAAAALSGDARRPELAAFAFITLGMLAGSWIGGRRVTAVLAEGVTRLDHREGLIANLVTAALVAPGAALGLPLSTTHVAAGAIIGTALSNDAPVNRRTVQEILLAWILTLPGAGLCGIAIYELLNIASMA